MNTEQMLELVATRRKAAGLLVRTYFDGREPHDYYAKDIASRDALIGRLTARIGMDDPCGHIIRKVEVVA